MDAYINEENINFRLFIRGKETGTIGDQIHPPTPENEVTYPTGSVRNESIFVFLM